MINRCISTDISSGKVFLWLAFVALIGLALVACKDDRIQSRDNPRFVASPSIINFSEVNLHDTAERTVEIWNEGSGDLHLRSITLNDNTGNAFEKGNSWPTDETLGSDESIQLSVLYSPTTEEHHSGSITMTTNDLDATSVTLEITTLELDTTTLAQGGELFIDPQHVDFSQVPAGHEQWALVNVTNIGTDPLSIDDVFEDSPSLPSANDGFGL